MWTELFSFTTEVHLEPSQTSKMELSLKISEGFNPLTIFAQSIILGPGLIFEYASLRFFLKGPHYHEPVLANRETLRYANKFLKSLSKLCISFTNYLSIN